ncbi:hypothetical protein ACLB2K_007061 [Fragaria x ananassa]
MHDISDPVSEAIPSMPFDFDLGYRKATVMFSFKYERVVGFCQVCGLLEHLSQGCGGPPDVTKVQQISLVSVTEVERNILGFGRSPAIKNPNPSFRQGLGLDRVRSNPLRAPMNPFSGGVLLAPSPSSFSSQSESIFSIPGVSASGLARQTGFLQVSISDLAVILGKGFRGSTSYSDFGSNL